MRTSRPIIDEREHRRGLVLGLTLAEVLLLLLFLLLLALGARLQQLSARVAVADRENDRLEASVKALSPLLARLKLGGQSDKDDVRTLAEKLGRVDRLEGALAERDRTISQMRQETAVLNTIGPDTVQRLIALKSILREAARINPNDPPEVLKRALAALEETGVSADNAALRSQMWELKSVLESLGPDPEKALDDLKNVVESASRLDPNNPPELLQRALKTYEVVGANADSKDMAQKITTLNDTVTVLQGERDRFKRDRDNLMRSGRGLVYPSCWTGPAGETEFIFDVNIFDSGVVVQDSAPAYRKTDDAWKYVDDLPRSCQMPEARFQKATSRLFAWSRDHECRFFVTMRDFTGATSKDRYKKLQRTVEENFYVKRVDPAAHVGDAAEGGPLVSTPQCN